MPVPSGLCNCNTCMHKVWIYINKHSKISNGTQSLTSLRLLTLATWKLGQSIFNLSCTKGTVLQYGAAGKRYISLHRNINCTPHLLTCRRSIRSCYHHLVVKGGSNGCNHSVHEATFILTNRVAVTLKHDPQGCERK